MRPTTSPAWREFVAINLLHGALIPAFFFFFSINFNVKAA